jgi:cytochrome c-type biogenesis protein
MQYLILFLEGIATFISPCLLPMLPVYISYFAAGETNRKRALTNSVGFVAGFTIIFVILGAFAGALGGLLAEYRLAVNLITGAIVIVFGLNFIGLINIGLLNMAGGGIGSKARDRISAVKELRFFQSVLFGLVFSIGWTPCVSAFLGSALMLASQQGGMLTGILMLSVYSLGLGVPFVASAILLDRLKAAFDFIRRNYRIINIVSGLFLVAIGVLMATGLMGRYLSLLAF